MNRRSFLSAITKVLGVAVFSQSFLKGVLNSSAYAGDGAEANEFKMVDPKESLASAVKYVEDSKKAPLAKGGHCATCSLYTKKGKQNGKEVGTCSIFTGKLVYGNGFCNSYSKKA